jgi:hypothetical protein
MAAFNASELVQMDQQHLIHSLYHPGDHRGTRRTVLGDEGILAEA